MAKNNRSTGIFRRACQWRGFSPLPSLVRSFDSNFVPLRMDDAQFAIGDDPAHGETAYAITLEALVRP